MVQVCSFVFPPGGQLQRVVCLAQRALALEVPHILQNQRLCFNGVLVANYIARISRRYLDQLLLHIADQFTTVNLGVRNFQSFLVLYFIVFALCRDTPSVKSGDLFARRIEGHDCSSVIASIWTKDFIRSSYYSFDLVSRLDGDISLGVEEHSVGLFIVSR